MKCGLLPRVAALASVLFLSGIASAQSMARFTLDTWQDKDLAETFDHPLIEEGGHVQADAANEELSHWDSYGRVRINRDDPNAPFFGYRVLFIDASTGSRVIHSAMDEFDLALGLHLGQISDWDISTILGLGYSSTHPFKNSTGIFGIGHITAEHHYDENNSLVLSMDYEGNSGLLPDVPLPGFAFIHHEKNVDVMFGYPMSSVIWRPLDKLEITAQYTVPFTGDFDIEYRVANHFGIYSDTSNFFQGFVTDVGDVGNRQFFQMRRTEAGLRFIYNPWVDASLGIGYAFDQSYFVGEDVRDLRAITRISDEPYVALMVRGRF